MFKLNVRSDAEFLPDWSLNVVPGPEWLPVRGF